MKCLNCNNNIVINKSFKNLLDFSPQIICDKCYKKYPFKLSYEVIPLNIYKLHVYSIFPKRYMINSLAYSYEYSKVFEYLFNKDKNNCILLYDNLILNKYKLDDLEALATLVEKDIYIVCNYFN